MAMLLLIVVGLGALLVMVRAVAIAANRGPGWERRRATYAPGTEDAVPWFQGSDSGSEHRHDAGGGAGSGYHHAAHHHDGGGFDAGHHHTSHDSGSFSDTSSFDFGGGHHH